MGRTLRIEYPGALYHITSRGNERKSIFLDEADRKKFLHLLKKYHNRHGILVQEIESLRVHSSRLAACAVIPADAGIQKPDGMPPDQVRGRLDQVRHDAEYPAACGGVVYSLFEIVNCQRAVAQTKY